MMVNINVAWVVQVMEMMGAEVTWAPNSVTVKGTGKLKGVDVNMNKMPDAAMTLAVAALFADVRVCLHSLSLVPIPKSICICNRRS